MKVPSDPVSSATMLINRSGKLSMLLLKNTLKWRMSSPNSLNSSNHICSTLKLIEEMSKEGFQPCRRISTNWEMRSTTKSKTSTMIWNQGWRRRNSMLKHSCLRKTMIWASESIGSRNTLTNILIRSKLESKTTKSCFRIDFVGLKERMVTKMEEKTNRSWENSGKLSLEVRLNLFSSHSGRGHKITEWRVCHSFKAGD